MRTRIRIGLLTSLSIFVLALIPIVALVAEEAPRDEIEFDGAAIEFNDYPGIEVRVSKPFLRYQKWDPEHTGNSWFSIALELTNNTDEFISAVTFATRLYDDKEGLVSQGTNSTGPMTFEPQDGDVLIPGYRGVYDAFILRDREFYGEFGRLEFEIIEVKTASASVSDYPEFSSGWLSFDEHPGLEFQLSEPFRFLDDLSGDERFSIAMKFKNNSGNPVGHINFFVRIFDDIGPLYEREVQEHNQKYEPAPESFFATEFEADYEGINRSFYTNDLPLFDVFTKIEITLISIE
jgi:hypothetical protein